MSTLGTELASPPTATQRCPRCRRFRDLAEFSPSQRGVIGRYCKACSNDYRRRNRRARRPPSYVVMHVRIRKHRGPASQYTCWECGERQAMDWAYNHDDPSPVVGKWKGERVVYSIDVMRYRALCRRCHSTLDAKLRSGR